MFRPPTPAVALAMAIAGGSACSHEWDPFDPRLGSAGSGPSGTSVASATTAATTSTASTGGAGPGAGGDGGAGPAQGGGSSTQVGGGGSTAAEGGGDGGGGGEGVGGSPPTTVVYEADVAACIDPATPDPDACEAAVGFAIMSIDAEAVAGQGGRWEGYVRIPVGEEIAGRTVTAVRLRLHVPASNGADSPSSGEVWEVAPFSAADLAVAAPAQVQMLAPARGPVELDTTIELPLVGLELEAGTPVHLGLQPTTTNGVDYVNTNGATPPMLVVDLQ